MAAAITRRTFLAGAASAAALHTLRGLAVEPRGARKRILVVGAGLAGLAAAFELVEAGHEVTVLEARTRPGGRVHTLRDGFAEGLYAEAGAMSIPESHTVSLHYARRLGLALAPPPPPARRNVAWMRGERLVWPVGEEPAWPFALTANERALGVTGMRERYQGREVALAANAAAAGGLDGAEGPIAELRRLDDLTLAGLWRRNGASEEAVALLRLGPVDLLGDGVEAQGAFAGLRELAHRRPGEPRFRIEGGSDLFPEAFAARLGPRIRYGAAVEAIAHSPEDVTVTFREPGGVRELRADHAVLAVPFPLLREIAVTPPFAGAKREAIEGLRNTSVTRTYLQCRSRPWEAEGLTGNAVTDLPIMLLRNVSEGIPGRRAILESYAGGEQARRLAAMRPDDRLRTVVEQADLVYPGLAAEVEGGQVWVWDDDPWARGAYAWLAPGEASRWMASIAAPVGRLHFAGDHTSGTPGWMNGALSSGRRAAAEIDPTCPVTPIVPE